MTAVPAPAGVNTPADVIVPSVACQLTAELNAPVPWTVAVQVEVPVVKIDVGLQFTETEVIVACAATVTVAVPDFVESCVDVAVMVAVPVPEAVNTPALLTVPELVGLTDHVTEALKLPVPFTVGVQVDVCFEEIEAGEQFTVTEVIVGGAGVVPPLPLLQEARKRGMERVRSKDRKDRMRPKAFIDPSQPATNPEASKPTKIASDVNHRLDSVTVHVRWITRPPIICDNVLYLIQDVMATSHFRAFTIFD